MTVDDLVRTLRARRIMVWSENGKLRFRAPQGALTDELRELMRLHRPALLELVPDREPVREPAPASFAQQAMWFLNRATPESPAYNVAFAARIVSTVDVEALRRAAQALIDRHGSLRTLYEEDDGAPIAYVHPSLAVHFEHIDAAAWNESALYERVLAAYRVPFDLNRGPLARFDLFTVAPENHVLLISAHHIAMDGWSVWLMLDELRALYAGTEAAGSAALPQITTDYAEYARWQSAMVEGPEGAAHRKYWERQLAGELPVLELPVDHARLPNRPPRGGSHRLALGLERTAGIKALAREEGATTFAVVLSAYALMLSRYGGERDIVVGSPTSGRTDSRFEGVLGCFVNPVALRVRCDEALHFRSLVGQVRATVLGALEHQDYPFRLISEQLGASRGFARGQLFQVDFALQKPQRFAQVAEAVGDGAGDSGTIDFGGLRMQMYDMPQQEGQLDLTLELIESRGALVGSFKYDANLFERTTIERMESHLLQLIDSALAAPEQPLDALNMLPPGERERLLIELNATHADFPATKGYAEYFEEQVRRTPDAVAVTDDDGSLSYGELNARANRIARALIAAGVGPDQPVGLLAPRGSTLLTWILATFKAGGAYLPLDPRIPDFRHAEILRQSCASAVIVADPLAERLAAALAEFPADARPVVFQASDLHPDTGDPANLAPQAAPGTLAYIIFTSGSTGRPKGAMVPHRAMLNHFWSKLKGYALTAADVVVQSAPQGFDISVWQFLAILLAGGRVRIAPDAVTQEPARLFALVEAEGVTILELVPSALRAYIDELPPASGAGSFGKLRWLLLGAESLAPDLCRRWMSRWPHTQIVNTYGPSECADDTTRYIVPAPPGDDEVVIPIGRPVDNVRVYVLDRTLALVPQGVPGELCIGGASVGLGYLNDSVRTAAAFVPDPFCPSASTTMYRTGDRCRLRSDGMLEFLGRIDQQVKIHGFRVEPGEIEATLATYPGVREAVVLAKNGIDGMARLVAFITTAGDAAPLVAEIQGFLHERLPDYMVPGTIDWLPVLPVTANGKVDRQALRALEGRADGPADHAPAHPGTEQELEAIWSELLGAARIGRHDSFFQLGGHSILAARLMARMRQRMGVELPVRALFETPTLAGLAAQVEAAKFALAAKGGDPGATAEREQFTL